MSVLEEEEEALRAMWGSDFHRHGNEFSITIKPLQEDMFTIVNLIVKVGSHYPSVVPEIRIRRIQGGVGFQLMYDLCELLFNESGNLVEEPMMVVLSLLTQEWCTRHNVSDTPLGRQWQAQRAQEDIMQEPMQENMREDLREDMQEQSRARTLELQEPLVHSQNLRQAVQTANRKQKKKKVPYAGCTNFQPLNLSIPHVPVSPKASWIELEAKRVEQDQIKIKKDAEEEHEEEHLELHEMCDLVEDFRLKEPHLTRKELAAKISKKMESEGRECNVKRWYIEQALSGGLYKDQVCVVCLERTIVSERHMYEKCNHPNHWACKSCHTQMLKRGQPHRCPLCRRDQLIDACLT
jgi:hypothetical protein